MNADPEVSVLRVRVWSGILIERMIAKWPRAFTEADHDDPAGAVERLLAFIATGEMEPPGDGV
jgi:hypothetical protein